MPTVKKLAFVSKVSQIDNFKWAVTIWVSGRRWIQRVFLKSHNKIHSTHSSLSRNKTVLSPNVILYHLKCERYVVHLVYISETVNVHAGTTSTSLLSKFSPSDVCAGKLSTTWRLHMNFTQQKNTCRSSLRTSNLCFRKFFLIVHGYLI